MLAWSTQALLRRVAHVHGKSADFHEQGVRRDVTDLWRGDPAIVAHAVVFDSNFLKVEADFRDAASILAVDGESTDTRKITNINLEIYNINIKMKCGLLVKRGGSLARSNQFALRKIL